MKKTIEHTLSEFPVISTRESELSILSGIITTEELLLTAKNILVEKDFSSDDTISLWRTLVSMEENKEPINASTISSKITNMDFLMSVIASENVPYSEEGMQQYCFMLKEASMKRRCYFETCSLLSVLTSEMSTQEEIFGQLSKMTDDLVSDRMRNEVVTVSEACEELKEEIRRRRSGEIYSVPTGFSRLDEQMKGGMESDEMIILAARPSVGKTAVALQMVKNAAMLGVNTMVFSLEMSNSSLMKRLLVSEGRLTSYQMATGQVGGEEFDYSSSWLKTLPLRFCDNAFTLEQIESKLTRAHMRGEVQFAMIDYLGLVDTASRNMTQYQMVTYVSRRLKLLAKRLHIPILLLCQLSRGTASEGRSPELYDLRDSGAIEQDADCVLMLENPSRNLVEGNFPSLPEKTDDELKQMVLMWIRKMRRGVRDKAVLLQASNEYTRFTEVNPEYRQDDFQPEDNKDFPF